MAPITRSSVHGRSVSREKSWQIPSEDESLRQTSSATRTPELADDVESMEGHTTEDETTDGASDGASGEDSILQTQELRSPIGLPSSNAQQMLQPLQQTADRVTRQVEDFARRLDRFHSSRTTNRVQLWEEALDLARFYGSIATSRKSQASSDLLQAHHSSRTRQSLQAVAEEGQLEVQRAQSEVDLWQLFTVLMSCQDPNVQAEYQREQKTCLRSLNRYSSDAEIWQTFLSADLFALEYQEILRWLHSIENSSRPPIDDITSTLRQKAERGDGIWSAGWLFTKESIKTQKRNRLWPKPLDQSNPGLESSHVRKSDSGRLVANLDPDAKVRESAALEEPDEYHEQAAWTACWEMLRRGTSADLVQAWWSERKENWRAISTTGGTLSALRPEEREWTRFISLWKRNDWAAACYKICRSEAVSTQHEAAVYGLLCGDLQVPLQICQTINDYLFVNLNAFLIERYRDFGTAVSQKESRQTFQPGPAKFDEIRRLMYYCQHNEKTRQESRDPFKAIQSMVVSRDFASFFLRQGRALAQITSLSQRTSYLIVSDGVRETSESAQIAASDPDGLRIIAHQLLILKALGFLDELYAKHESVVENNLTAYIGWLQQEGKMSMIPLYASTLSPERGARVLGAVCMEITDVKERDLMAKLFKKYELDIALVLWMQYQLNAATTGLVGKENPRTIKPVAITLSAGSGKVKSLKVKPAFTGEEINDAEDLLIRSLEWYRYGDKNSWSQTCHVASTLYKSFISRGRLAAARNLYERAPLSQISKAALRIDLKDVASSGNASDDENFEMDGFAEEEPAQPISPSKRRHLIKRYSDTTDDDGSGSGQHLLADQAQTWRQLEELVEVLDALEKWSEIVEEVEKTKGDPAHMRTVKKILQSVLEDVRNAMYPLWEKDFLSSPSDEAEAVPLRNIRNVYLPECILAYNSVLYFAGHAISRNWLSQCMNLAQNVATIDNITEAFVESCRMKELVAAFALSSQALLHANEQGGRKGKRDEMIEIWQVKPQEVGLSKDAEVSQIG